MSVGESPNDSRFQQVAAALGVADPAAIATIGREGLAKFPHRQLVESSRQLGLSGISRLSKDALAARLWEELERSGVLQAPKVERAGRTVLEPPAERLSHKFEVGKHARPSLEEPRDIPWGYEWDRVTAMPVDPDRLYVYWEVTDPSVERARKQLGAAGAEAWLSLRVYDVTGRIFDGTNAHHYFDHGVERHDRQWFFHLGRPTSEAIIEVGLKSREGYFVKIARSGRIEFPRREPVGWGEPDWLTVRSSTGPVEHAGRGTPGGGAGGGGGGGAPHGHAVANGHGFDAAPLWHMRRSPWDEVFRYADGGQLERISWEEYFSSGQFEGGSRTVWEGPVTYSSWESGPFSYPVEVPESTREEYVGPLHVYKVAGRTHVVHGPWQVVIRGLGARAGRQVVSRWEIHRSWVAEEGHEIKGVTVRGGQPGGSSELMAMGSSERRWRAGSEVRLGGASELYFAGASEVRLAGASERMYAGASEWMTRGASERMYAGASEWLYRGASENLYAGASERLYAGASERLLAGASERLFEGASERLLAGASERLQGRRDDAVSVPEGSPYPALPFGNRPNE